ncbi:hypothetical protein ACIQVE_07230 [Pseudomonas sp. NPDC098747]|uniref:hypothetical protein n=1 Tax=Pseudomonas sp. NPDC098747 TaxID=3364487 RepID=UPI00383B7C0D
MGQEHVSDPVFKLYYSYCVEEVSEAFNRRLDRLLAMALFVLGASVMATVTSRMVIGLLVAFISGFQMTYKFGERAGKSKNQKTRYDELLNNRSAMTDKSLSSKLAAICKSDSTVPSWMKAVAHKKACIMLGEDTDVVLTRWQRFLTTISGAGPITTQTS